MIPPGRVTQPPNDRRRGTCRQFADCRLLCNKAQPQANPAANFACLTGSAQIAACWLLLGRELDRADYIDAACRANAFVRRTIRVTGNADICGGVKGAFPVDGDYGRFQCLNCAAKFTLDAQRMERLPDDQQGDRPATLGH